MMLHIAVAAARYNQRQTDFLPQGGVTILERAADPRCTGNCSDVILVPGYEFLHGSGDVKIGAQALLLQNLPDVLGIITG